MHNRQTSHWDERSYVGLVQRRVEHHSWIGRRRLKQRMQPDPVHFDQLLASSLFWRRILSMTA